MNQDVSIVIRAKNEEKTIGKVIRLCQKQSLRPKEIIVADNQSADDTVRISKNLGCKVVNVPNPFNHALSCNLGIDRASCPLVLLTNAHSYPSSAKYLENGACHFIKPKIAGVWGLHLTDNESSFWERCFEILAAKSQKQVKIFKKLPNFQLGVLSTVAAMIRKDLWESYPFDEKVARIGAGGEDIDWAWHFLKKGYRVVFDPSFSVYHSHGDNLVSFVRRNLSWDWMYFTVQIKHHFPKLWLKI